jgi:hypothetical protein
MLHFNIAQEVHKVSNTSRAAIQAKLRTAQRKAEREMRQEIDRARRRTEAELRRILRRYR